MAVVRLLEPTDMTALPSGGGAQNRHVLPQAVMSWNSSSSFLLQGEFVPGGNDSAGGVVREAFIDTSDTTPTVNIHITGLSFNLTPGFASDVFFTGGFLPTLVELLSGDDTIFGSSGGFGEDPSTLFGGAGNDILVSGDAADQMLGGIDDDTVSYEKAPAGLFAGLEEAGFNTGWATGDTYSNVENLKGSRFDDFLYGSGIANRLSGDAGNDTLVGKNGGDVLDGGSGSDEASYDTSGAIVASLLQPSRNTGHADDDRYISIENLSGSSYSDTLFGNNAANRVEGSNYPANDFTATGDHDRLFGLGGNDQLFGYWGNDDLTGGPGADRLTGGLRQDDFIFNSVAESSNASRDRIMDFARADGDRIILSSIDARTTASGNQAFTWRGNSAFSGVAGQLRYQNVGNDTHILGDTNGDKIADLVIVSDVVIAFAKGDFVL